MSTPVPTKVKRPVARARDEDTYEYDPFAAIDPIAAIGIGNQERELQAAAQVRAIQDWLGGAHQAPGACRLGLENKTSLEYQGALLPTTLRRRTALAGVPPNNRNLVHVPFVAETNTQLNHVRGDVSEFAFKDALKRMVTSATTAGHPVAKKFHLWQLMPSDFLRTEQQLTCYSPTVLRLRTHPLVPVGICNMTAVSATTANLPADHPDTTTDMFATAPANDSIVVEWCERYVSQPRYQAILDDVIREEYTFPGFEIRGSQVNQLQNESALTGRCQVGPGRVH